MFREDPPQREAQVEALGLSLMKINFFPLSLSLVFSPIHHELTFITLRSRLIFFIHDFLRLLPRQSLSLAARNFPLWYHYFSYSKQTQKNQKMFLPSSTLSLFLSARLSLTFSLFCILLRHRLAAGRWTIVTHPDDESQADNKFIFNLSKGWQAIFTHQKKIKFCFIFYVPYHACMENPTEIRQVEKLKLFSFCAHTHFSVHFLFIISHPLYFSKKKLLITSSFFTFHSTFNFFFPI